MFRAISLNVVRSAVLYSLLCLMGSAVVAAQHEFGDLNIAVTADTNDIAASPDYQITVENEELLLTRLTATYQGILSNSFVADLDKDGAFEVIVTFSSANGHETDVHVYSWKNSLLQPHKVADLNDAQRIGYQGNDEFAVANGYLLRIYQVYEKTEGVWQATAEQRRLRYSLSETRWLPE
jgi:hypothetical protein